MIKVSTLMPDEMAALHARSLPVRLYGMVVGTTTDTDEAIMLPTALVDDTAQPDVTGIDSTGAYTWYADIAGPESDGYVLLDFQGTTVPKDEAVPVALAFTVRFDLPYALETLLAIAQTGTVQFLGTSANDFTPEQLSSPTPVPVESALVFHEVPTEGLQALLPLIALGIQMRSVRIQHEAERGVPFAA